MKKVELIIYGIFVILTLTGWIMALYDKTGFARYLFTFAIGAFIIWILMRYFDKR